MSTTTPSSSPAAAHVPVDDPSHPLNPVALRIAYWGMLPIVLGTGLVWLFDRDSVEHSFIGMALAAYVALVISFLGGLYWGLAAVNPEMGSRLFVIGIVPAIVAWLGVLMPPAAGLVVLGVMLVAGYLIDRRHYPQLDVAAWLVPRFRLSAVAALCCFLAAAGS